MTWERYIEFTQLVLARTPDSIMRNYDLYNLNGSLPGKMLDKAVARMGVAQYNTVRHMLVPIVFRMMANVGVPWPDTEGTLAHHIRAWYTWDRIHKGELRQWPMLKPDPLLSLI